ncbi:MAG: hypothetical protein KDE35_08650 [Geminicoccaceae bacterium]|nr:hypothetical protein [Geminicoccaceae bacterium]
MRLRVRADPLSPWFRAILDGSSRIEGVEAGVSDGEIVIDGTPCRGEVWSFAIDGGDWRHAGSAALWAGRRTAAAALLARPAGAPDHPAVVVDQVQIKTVPHDPAATRERLLDAAAAMPARVIRRRMAGVADPRIAPIDTPGLANWRRRLLPAALVRNLLVRLWRERLEERWTIGIVDRPPAELMAAELMAAELMADPLAIGIEAAPIRWLEPRPAGYLADPFAAVHAGAVQLFAEACDFDRRKGYLVTAALDDLTRTTDTRTVLEEPHHLSFPQVFEHEGRWWMLPEAVQSGRIDLYRADPFPDRWKRVRTLVEDFAGADPVLHRHENCWWLFATDHAQQDETTLCLFHAPDLEGPWRPHPMNPVKTDIGSARPAGPLFRRGADLIRPAQDCSRRYGGAVVFNRVLALDARVYVEETVGRLDPDPAGPWPHGLHTLTPIGDGRSLIDGKREHFSWRRWAHGLKQLL